MRSSGNVRKKKREGVVEICTKSECNSSVHALVPKEPKQKQPKTQRSSKKSLQKATDSITVRYMPRTEP